MSPWTPPGADPVAHAALVSGIPSWVEVSVFQWVSERIVDTRTTAIRDDFLAAWDVSMRNLPPHQPLFTNRRADVFWAALDEELRVALLDFLLAITSSDNAARLEDLLRTGGSELRVGARAGNAGLEKRVPQGVADAVDSIIDTSATAGALLSEAWHAAYGRNPNPEEAYEKAIKAVEEAGAEVVLPENPKATLGTMIAAVRDQGDWSLPLESNSALIAHLEMMKALWEGQESRHGGNGYRKPAPAEAEAAVLLAVALVQFFTAGLIARSARK